MKMLNESYLSGPFFSIQANISSNNKFCSAHTLNHLYWDYCSLCRLMSMEKACSACITDEFFVCPLHTHTYTEYTEKAEREREICTGTYNWWQFAAHAFFFHHSFVCAHFRQRIFGKNKKKKKLLLSRLFLRICQNYVRICVYGAARTNTHPHNMFVKPSLIITVESLISTLLFTVRLFVCFFFCLF